MTKDIAVEINKIIAGTETSAVIAEINAATETGNEPAVTGSELVIVRAKTADGVASRLVAVPNIRAVADPAYS
jgi:hypothetical protein